MRAGGKAEKGLPFGIGEGRAIRATRQVGAGQILPEERGEAARGIRIDRQARQDGHPACPRKPPPAEGIFGPHGAPVPVEIEARRYARVHRRIEAIGIAYSLGPRGEKRLEGVKAAPLPIMVEADEQEDVRMRRLDHPHRGLCLRCRPGRKLAHEKTRPVALEADVEGRNPQHLGSPRQGKNEDKAKHCHADPHHGRDARRRRLNHRLTARALLTPPADVSRCVAGTAAPRCRGRGRPARPHPPKAGARCSCLRR